VEEEVTNMTKKKEQRKENKDGKGV